MTDEQRKKISQLSRCTFLPGSYQKRFVRDMESLLSVEPSPELSEKQATYLDKLHHMYRKQIGRWK